MKSVSLNLAQILAVAYVWQCEILPRYLPHWKRYHVKSGCVRKPELYISAYNALLDQLCSGNLDDELKYTKGAMSMLASNIGQLLNVFEPPLSLGVEWNNVSRRLVPGHIVATEQIIEPSVEAKVEARALIREILSIDERGNKTYAPPRSYMTFEQAPMKKTEGSMSPMV